MTVSSTTTKVSYNGNGTNHSFQYSFKIFSDADLEVYIRSSTGTETLQTLNTNYIVTDAGNDAGGNVLFKYNTLDSSDAHYSATDNRPVTGETVIIKRVISLTQGTDYVANDPFPAESHEDALDRLTFISQQMQEELDRSIKASVGNTFTGSEFTISASDRANKLFAFDSSGNLSVSQEIGRFRGTDTTTTTSDYDERDLVKSTTTAELNNIYIALQDSPSGTALTNTTYWALVVDAVSAATSATNAASSASAASDDADDAEKLAINAEDSQFTLSDGSTTGYSALHYAAKAEDHKDDAETAKTAAQTAKTAAELALDTFDDRFLGAKSSDPTVDNDGDALITGALYFNTTSGMKVYDGSSWDDIKPTSAEQTNIDTVAGDSADIQTVAGDSADIQSLAALSTEIGALGAASVRADMSALAATAVLADMDALGDLTTEIGSLGNITSDITAVSGISSDVSSLADALEKTYTVTVASNVFVLDGTSQPTITLFRGNTYIFDQSDSSNSGHPIAFRTSADASYTTGVTTTGTAGSAGAKTTFIVPSNAPNSLKYYCTVHGNGMGNTITVTDSNISLVATNITNVNNVGGSISNVNTVATDITNVNTAATNLSGINSFAERYRVTSADPTTSLDAGDLAFVTGASQLKYYDGSAWQGISPGITAVSGDSSPALGGNLDVNGNSIVSASNGDIAITPNGTGSVVIDGLSHPQSDGTAGQFLKTDGSGQLAFATVASDLVDDTTPQLGGTLDTNGQAIQFGASKWTIELDGNNLLFKYNGTAKIKFADDGEIVTVDDVTAFGTI